jgi:hypothetical protein
MAATPGVCRVGVEREPRVEGNGMSRLVGNIGIRLAFVGILAVGGILFRYRDEPIGQDGPLSGDAA